MAATRPSHLLTRSWVLTPSSFHYRAGKPSRRHSVFAYRIFTEIPRQNIRRSCNPYRHASFRADGSRRPSQSPRVSRRSFHQSSAWRTSHLASTRPHVSVHIAAASSGKGSKYQPEKSTFDYYPGDDSGLGLELETKSIFQKRRARPDSGQDAYFAARVGKGSDETAFGICDGVGGWLEHGIDPADFSHGLCSHMAKTALQWSPRPADGASHMTPQQLMELGYQKATHDPHIQAGGSTACVGIVDGKGRVRIANLGDSGFIHLRCGSVQRCSIPQTHDFNTPYQMSITPPEIVAQAMVFGGMPLNDLPERADLMDYTLHHGDVLILATDGVWDNLSPQDILGTVSTQMRQLGAWQRSDEGIVVTDALAGLVDVRSAPSQYHLPGTLQSIIAAAIVDDAKTASLDRKRDGPFAKAWQRHAPYDSYHGGKVDDISVLVIISTADEGSAQAKAMKAKL